jgi:hypothetical protein
MANNKASENRRVLGELSQEALKQLNDIAGELDEVEKDADALEKAGFDTSRIRERVAWGRQVKKIIEERFGMPEK